MIADSNRQAPTYVKLGLSAETNLDNRRLYIWQRFWGHTGELPHRQGVQYRMIDPFYRVRFRNKDERYISNWDGGLKELVVQCVDSVFDSPNDVHWNRARITDLSPFSLRVAEWCQWGIERPGISKRRRILRRVVGGFLLIIANVDISALLGEKNQSSPGFYEGFHYRLHGYPEFSRNQMELHDRGSQRAPHVRSIGVRTLFSLGIFFICLTSPSQWDAMARGEPFPEYIVLAYVQAQFPKEMQGQLIQLGMQAAREAGVHHFWVACSCMANTDEIYHISDFVRGAKAVAIAINGDGTQGSLALLKQFGERVWTLPEILLAANSDNMFRIYSPGRPPLVLTRHQFMRDVWSDSHISRQLVEHFQNSLQLSRLQLSVIALQSFYARDRTLYYPADIEYALMGLLLCRVEATKNHTAFEVFASLSLLADSDAMLERMICLQPMKRNQPYHIMDDAYGAKLYDIYPSIQVSGIGKELRNTVIIDGFRGAKVRWKSFAPVNSVKRLSIARRAAAMVMTNSSIVFLIGVILVAFKKWWAFIILFFGLAGSLAAPELLIKIAGGKKWQPQPWLFGIEGYCEIGEIESKIFGSNQGHLRWSPWGSPLSRHKPDEFGNVQGCDPMKYPEVQEKVNRIRSTGESQIFMLVDTHVMEVTLFAAERPPIAFLLGGSEGGMARAIGVSLDWTTNTLYRECVLRMDSTVGDIMGPVRRVRIGLRRRN
ncbi:uncharacterized protein K441DRAFT_563805 [Cenococcum geophilum 1.58]|uniref:uncharacterized protein n=1 Tax=Cenococcum geophilum 1.58 TaxID=794803 RepID=UPI00358EE586|nr:hypothetical protein K441DRAFT_563805 [Cenococcum geophilum 1.58]